MRHVKDAEANDMIHMGSDHRCVMATFMITMLNREKRSTRKKKDAKAQVKRENAAAAEADRTLEEAEVQEIKRRSMKRSSTAANQRGVPALIEP